ncbi:hypothetical protein ACFLVC_02850 [Chloroflexota bacterium]
MLKISAILSLTFLFSVHVIVASWGLATFLTLTLALFWALPHSQSDYTFRLEINKQLIGSMFYFSLGNHVARLLWLAPFMLFPIIVANTLGPEMNAYFFIPWIIAQTLFGLPLAVSYSLFSEGSANEYSLRANISKSLKLCLLILFPSIVLLSLFRNQLLLLFGVDYYESSSALLFILVASVIPVAINQIGLSVMRVRENIGWVLIVSALSACLTLVSGYLLMIRIGITGIGIAWISTQTLVGLIVGIYLFFTRDQLSIHETPSESFLPGIKRS